MTNISKNLFGLLSCSLLRSNFNSRLNQQCADKEGLCGFVNGADRQTDTHADRQTIKSSELLPSVPLGEELLNSY